MLPGGPPKAQELLQRHSGVVVPYRTLHRYAARELGFGGRRVTVRVADGKPGEELQLDFGAVEWIKEEGRRRRVWERGRDSLKLLNAR